VGFRAEVRPVRWGLDYGVGVCCGMGIGGFVVGLKPGVKNGDFCVDGPCGSFMPVFGNVDTPCDFTYVALLVSDTDVPVLGLPNLFLSILSANSQNFNTPIKLLIKHLTNKSNPT
jgi:hypothetical protein